MTTALTDTTPIPTTPNTSPNTSTPLSTAAASVPTAFTAPEDIRLFRAERSCLERYLPGLDAKLAEIPLLELEKPGNKGLALFRDAGGAGLLVGPEHGGLGASALDAVRIQRAIGTRSPSLAVATTMHHFSVASLAELSALNAGFEWAMLQAVAEQRWLVSSAFAEGRPGQHILSPGMRAERTDGGLLVSGV